jgi:NitT/TauT family transport system ATP-binding protein
MVEFRNVSLSYPLPGGGALAALDNFSASFPAGTISAIVGASGCGKTSLIRLAAGLLRPSSGEIFVQGERLRGARKDTSVIFQDYGLLPWKTARDNAELPLRLAGKPRRLRRERVGALLEEFGLARFENLYPASLSGGMKQRLALVRALAADARLVLMDEPFSSLDALTREDANDFLLGLCKKRPLTVIIVTHSIAEAAYLASRVMVVTGRNPGVPGAVFFPPESECRDDPRLAETCAAIRLFLKNAQAKLPA